MVDLKQLQRLAKEAAAREAELRQSVAKGRPPAEQESCFQHLKAAGIIAQIPARAETEAQFGRYFAIVMSVTHGDYDRPKQNIRWNFCDPDWLKGAARLVWDQCVADGLKPSLEHWLNSVRIEDGFNIVIHW